MAKKFVVGDKIENYLKCVICFHVLDDPRTLSCHHTFCSTCIDDVITFNEDGSAEIICPTCRCSTTLTKLQTTKDLPKPFMFLDLLEKVKQERKMSVDSCEGVKGCISHITRWCIECKGKLCESCFTQHVCSNKLSVVGDFHVFSNRFRMICNQHNALITRICTICNSQHLCVYCTNRDHKEHETLTLSAFTNNLKNQYLEKLTQAKEHFQLNNLCYEEAVEKTDECKQQLIFELDTRIIRKMNKYIENLNKQKQSIITQYENKVFNKKTKEWKERLEQHGLLQDNFVNSLMDTIKEIENMETFRVIVDEVANTKKINNLTTPQFLNVTLTNDTPQDIGTLSGFTFRGNSVTNPVVTEKLFQATEIQINKEECEKTVQLIKNLTEEFDQLSSSVNIATYEKCDIIHLITNNNFEKLQKIYFLDQNQLNDGEFIYSAVEHNKQKILKLLLKVQNIDINFVTKSFRKRTSLHLACERGYKDIVELLIRNNARVDVKDKKGQTPLNLASSEGHKEIVELLIHNNARVDVKDNDGQTPLHDASWFGRKEIVELLIRNNARVDEKDNGGWTPLYVASSRGHKEIVELLEEFDQLSSSVNITTYKKCDIIHLITNNNFEKLQKIYFLDQNQLNDGEFIYSAVEHNKQKILKLLLKVQNIDINFVTKCFRKRTSLHLACEKGYKEIVELLICNNARVDVKDNDGQTPLHDASWFGRKEIVELLIRNNARVNEKDNGGWTPLYGASSRGHKEIVELLESL